MRKLTVVLMPLLAACAILEQMPHGSSYDPSKIYLGDSVVKIAARDADRYGCIDTAMVCDRLTVASMICHC
ncbi:MAG TPA: hypothetical protein VFV10_09650 [Gammaproteobacteria bacterium]|nr:hypothetical protein [Gammaproteobacteria bacterium]